MTVFLLLMCLLLALSFEFSNGFHDTANAVATVIYTKALKPTYAVLWSGVMNFLGVLIGGIAVAYAMVELIPPDVLSPPNGEVAIGMLTALFISALGWNLATWRLGLPNSSSHALIGSLIGIAIENALMRGRSLGAGVDWHQVWKVLAALVVSPVLGFVLSLVLFKLVRLFLHDGHLYEPPQGDKPPVWWMRALLIATSSGVSFAHGSNDGQKAIGLIMLSIIGILPTTYALNRDMTARELAQLAQDMPKAAALIEQYGDDEKLLGSAAAREIGGRLTSLDSVTMIPGAERSAVRNDAIHVISELGMITGAKGASAADKKTAKAIHDEAVKAVQYAPWWVRILSALCLGVGTMIGYKRVVVTLGEKLGKQHLVPAQGASAELVGALLIGSAGFTGLPVSTTHVVTGGIAGTMVASGAGVQKATLWPVAAAWILTLPATMLISGGLFYLFEILV